jgi:hypothetical protein
VGNLTRTALNNFTFFRNLSNLNFLLSFGSLLRSPISILPDPLGFWKGSSFERLRFHAHCEVARGDVLRLARAEVHKLPTEKMHGSSASLRTIAKEVWRELLSLGVSIRREEMRDGAKWRAHKPICPGGRVTPDKDSNAGRGSNDGERRKRHSGKGPWRIAESIW